MAMFVLSKDHNSSKSVRWRCNLILWSLVLRRNCFGLYQSLYIAPNLSEAHFGCLIQNVMVKLLPLRLIIGVLANDLVWLKFTALLPGHLPFIKDGDPMKLKKKNVIFTHNTILPKTGITMKDICERLNVLFHKHWNFYTIPVPYVFFPSYNNTRCSRFKSFG